MKKIILILKEDIIHFPPVISLIKVLLDEGYHVVHIGVYSDEGQKHKFQSEGAVFLSTTPYDGGANPIKKLQLQLKFKKEVKKHLDNLRLTKDDVIWLIQSETIILLNELVDKYNCVLHQFEFAESKINWKYKLIAPKLNIPLLYQKAKAVVSCEYNRAHITKGLFNLNKVPYVLPNKMVFDDADLINVPVETKNKVDKLKARIAGKKVILYQGIFLDKERRLEEFCQAIPILPEDYVLVAMGAGSEMFDRLKEKYEGNRIIFIPFIRPPFHMLVTQLAYIGVLTYFPRPYSIGSVLNPIYCAPNKIFEYAKYGVPMISNDIPALYYTFKEFHCGKCIEYPMTPDAIVETIEEIEKKYQTYSTGATNYYNSVDIHSIVRKILES